MDYILQHSSEMYHCNGWLGPVGSGHCSFRKEEFNHRQMFGVNFVLSNISRLQKNQLIMEINFKYLYKLLKYARLTMIVHIGISCPATNCHLQFLYRVSVPKFGTSQ